MLSEAEKQLLVADWNRTEMDYPRGTPLAVLVEEQARSRPDAIAGVFGEESITYRELNERANRLARELVKHGAKPDELVGIFLERSLGMVIALLAVAKSGAAYLPMDPFLPAARLQFMMEESGLRAVITEKHLLSDLPSVQIPTVVLDGQVWQTNSGENLNVAVTPEHLAYAMYTSGSTGKPKGVQVPRGALTNFLWSMRDWLQTTELDRLLAVTTISFDIAGLEIWLPLVVGAQIIMVSRNDVADGTALRNLLDQHNITILQATPVTWRLLIEAGWQGKLDLKAICGGEAMPRELAAKLAPLVGKLWNLYGPTETTIWSTGYPVENGDSRVLIGRPIANTQCYILNQQRQLLPVGSVGELYIAGHGLARGYLNRPDLTAEKFVPDPFSTMPGARMYRTGDLARYMPDGNIECLGRNDHQVKIRGYRIELDEIQVALSRLPGIRQCVVVVREKSPGDAHLAAYYTASEGAKPAVPELRAALRTSLPDYMVPGWFVELEQLPLTYNGKIDIKALPDPFKSAAYSGSPISTELTQAESLLGKHPDLAAVALIMPPNSTPDSRPVAFAVPKGSDEPNVIALRKHMRGHCPEQVIPDTIVFLPEFPLTGNGSVDRVHLAESEWGPGAASAGFGTSSDAPQTETEVILARIWRELLMIPSIGVNDRFFDLGGHSLLTIQLIARVERETGHRLKLRDVLMDTLGQLAMRIDMN
jgi:amino acid adenylation domain-containing protein